MLAARATQLDAEQETSRVSSVWRDVYALMRCPSQPCDLVPHCWRDPFAKRNYKLRTHHLKALVESIQQGRVLSSHEDVPGDVREQLCAEEQERRERRSTIASAATPSFPPITTTNVMPSQAQDSPSTASTSGTPLCEKWPSYRANLRIPGPRDLAIMAYSEWQRSNVVDEAQQSEYQKSCDAILLDMLPSEQVYEDQDPAFYIRHGVKRGVARRCVGYIETWAELYRSVYHGEAED